MLYLLEWLRLQCVGFTPDGKLKAIAGHVCDEVELFLAVKWPDGTYNGFERTDQNFNNLDKLAKQAFENMSKVAKAIRCQGEIRQEMLYRFAHAPEVDTSKIIFLGDTQETLDTFTIEDVSRAWSIRRNELSSEVAIETREAYRKRGYGKQVVAAWAKYQLDAKRLNFYSHRKYNLESAALIKSLGASLVAETISYQEKL